MIKSVAITRVARSARGALAAFVVLAAAAATLSACNTTAGAGKDVSAAGRAVTNTATDVKNGN